MTQLFQSDAVKKNHDDPKWEYSRRNIVKLNWNCLSVILSRYAIYSKGTREIYENFLPRTFILLFIFSFFQNAQFWFMFQFLFFR